MSDFMTHSRTCSASQNRGVPLGLKLRRLRLKQSLEHTARLFLCGIENVNKTYGVARIEFVSATATRHDDDDVCRCGHRARTRTRAWLALIAPVLPLTHFVELVRGIVLRGAGWVT
jgi:hypothetical protein